MIMGGKELKAKIKPSHTNKTPLSVLLFLCVPPLPSPALLQEQSRRMGGFSHLSNSSASRPPMAIAREKPPHLEPPTSIQHPASAVPRLFLRGARDRPAGGGWHGLMGRQ